MDHLDSLLLSRSVTRLQSKSTWTSTTYANDVPIWLDIFDRQNTWKVEHLKGLDKCKHRERPEAAEESED